MKLEATPSENSPQIKLSAKDFHAAFQEIPTAYVEAKIKEYDFCYRTLSGSERDQCILDSLDALLYRNLIKAGEERHGQWEAGWGENLSLFKASRNIEAIIPKYFDKFNIVRWKQNWIKPISPYFEYRMLAIIQDWLFDKYLRVADEIYEFGCGTGHNLFRARQVNARAKLWGLDWASASQEIIRGIRENGIDQNMFGHRFDYFKPDYSFDLAKNSAVVTVASLEQIGSGFQPFLDFLISKKPKLCIHIEPIAELLDPQNVVDYFSIEYFKKRNYLSGYLTKLRELESEGKIKIHLAQRSLIGSFFIEGYSVIVWSPNQEQ